MNLPQYALVHITVWYLIGTSKSSYKETFRYDSATPIMELSALIMAQKEKVSKAYDGKQDLSFITVDINIGF